MNFKEKIKKVLDEQRLDREIKVARKKIADKEKEKVQVVKLNNENEEKVLDKELKENKINSDSRETNENKKSKLNIESLKDAGLVAVAIMLIGVGYINFSNKENTQDENQVIQTSSEYSNNLGDVQLVNSDNSELVENDNNISNPENTIQENEEDLNTVETSNNEASNITENANNDVISSSETGSSNTTNISSYFTELKLNRDNIYSQKLEAYQQIIDSTAVSSEQKAIAIQEIEKITEMQNSVSIAEELIKLKGFENVVIYVNENSVTVIVRSANLTSDQVAQIQNIVTRQLDVEASNISISNK